MTPEPKDPKKRERRALMLVQESLRNLEQDRFLEMMKPQTTDVVLDVGCSRGRFIDTLREKFQVAEVVGCDVDPLMADADKGIFVTAGEDLSIFPDGQFSVVVMRHSIEHMTDRVQAFKEAARVLKSDGKLQATVFLYDEVSSQEPSVVSAFGDQPVPVLTREQLETELSVAGLTITQSEVMTKLTSDVVNPHVIPSLLFTAQRKN